MIASEQPRAAPRDPDNLLDRLSRPSTMEAHYRHIMRREQRLLAGSARNRRAATCSRSEPAGIPAATCSLPRHSG